MGVDSFPAYVGEPETNGVIERFFRTLKEQALWGTRYETAQDVADAVERFTALYNAEWLLEKNGHRPPDEVHVTYDWVDRGKEVVGC